MRQWSLLLERGRFDLNGTTKPITVEGGHIDGQLFHDGPGDRRATITVSDSRGGPVRRWILFRDCSMIDCQVDGGWDHRAEVGRE